MVTILPIGMLAGAFMPALIWLWLFLHEDLHPEPKHLIFYVFSIGVLITLPVLAVQIAFRYATNLSDEGSIAFLIGLVIIEEVFKFFACYYAIRKNREFNEPLDAMIYM